MTTLEGVTIQNDQYGMCSTVENANVMNSHITDGTIMGSMLMGVTIDNPVISLNEASIINVGGESFTGGELLEVVKALKALRKIYPEHFI